MSTTSTIPSTPAAVVRLPVENLRRRISQAFFVVWILAALFTMPSELGTSAYNLMELTGFGLLIAAALGRLWCTIYIGGRKNRELCQAGPYSACRNPLYFFSFLGVAGACLALQSPLLLLATVPVFLIYYHYVIRAEESRLASYFGDSFQDYCASVPRFWPRLINPRDDRELEISLRHFLRGIGEVFWFLMAIVLIEAIEWAHVAALWPTHRLPI